MRTRLLTCLVALGLAANVVSQSPLDALCSSGADPEAASDLGLSGETVAPELSETLREIEHESAAELAVSEALDSSLIQEPKPKKEKKTIEGNANVGANASFGNTSVRSVAANGKLIYRLNKKNRLTGTIDWLYTDEKDQTTGIRSITQRRIRGTLQYDYFLSDPTYLFARVDALGDKQQDLRLRNVLSGGVGHEFWDRDDSSFAVEAGVAYTYEDFEALESDTFASARVSAKYMRLLTEDLKYDLSIEWLPGLESQDRQIVYAAHSLGLNLGKGFVTKLRHEFDYNNTPAPGKDRIDNRLIWTLGVEF